VNEPTASHFASSVTDSKAAAGLAAAARCKGRACP
jgi:hypothetical protein